MLDIASTKDVYRSLDQVELGQEDFIETFPIPYKAKFDFITCAGFLNNNQVADEIFEQMLLGLKNGGVMVFAARYSYIGEYWYMAKLQKLEKLGRIKAIKPAEAFFKYDQLPECYGKFTKTPVKVFAYQKTEEDSVLAYSRTVTAKKDSGMSVSTQDSQQ
jgi:SAM-dependent methyltransferase